MTRAEGRLDKAIEDYTKAIELNPQHANAYHNRGLAWSKKGDRDKAIEDYNKAIELNPQYADAYNNRGNAWLLTRANTTKPLRTTTRR